MIKPFLLLAVTVPIFAQNLLLPGETMRINERLVSPAGSFQLALAESGLSLVSRGAPAWHTPALTRVTRATMQTDGNLVLSDLSGRPVWATNTHGNPGSYLLLKNDGNLVIYRRDHVPLWASNTNGPREESPAGQLAPGTMLRSPVMTGAGGIRLSVTAGSNLILSRGVQRIWESATVGHKLLGLIFQRDGNAVLYDREWRAIWASGTHGNAGALLELHPQTGLQVVSNVGRPLWSALAPSSKLQLRSPVPMLYLACNLLQLEAYRQPVWAGVLQLLSAEPREIAEYGSLLRQTGQRACASDLDGLLGVVGRMNGLTARIDSRFAARSQLDLSDAGRMRFLAMSAERARFRSSCFSAPGLSNQQAGLYAEIGFAMVRFPATPDIGMRAPAAPIAAVAGNCAQPGGGMSYAGAAERLFKLGQQALDLVGCMRRQTANASCRDPRAEGKDETPPAVGNDKPKKLDQGPADDETPEQFAARIDKRMRELDPARTAVLAGMVALVNPWAALIAQAASVAVPLPGTNGPRIETSPMANFDDLDPNRPQPDSRPTPPAQFVQDAIRIGQSIRSVLEGPTIGVNRDLELRLDFLDQSVGLPLVSGGGVSQYLLEFELRERRGGGGTRSCAASQPESAAVGYRRDSAQPSAGFLTGLDGVLSCFCGSSQNAMRDFANQLLPLLGVQQGCQSAQWNARARCVRNSDDGRGGIRAECRQYARADNPSRAVQKNPCATYRCPPNLSALPDLSSGQCVCGQMPAVLTPSGSRDPKCGVIQCEAGSGHPCCQVPSISIPGSNPGGSSSPRLPVQPKPTPFPRPGVPK